MEAPIAMGQLIQGVASRLVFKGSPCDSYPCWNEGSCSLSNGSFLCSCTAAYLGDQCQYKVSSLCSSSNCSGPSCSFGGLHFDCPLALPNLFASCSSAPCANGGQCEDHNGAHRCSCPPAFTGPLCQYASSSAPLNWTTIEVVLVAVLVVLVLFIFLLICCSGNIGFYVSVPSKRYSRWEDAEFSDEEDNDIALGDIKRGEMRPSQTTETLLEGQGRAVATVVDL